MDANHEPYKDSPSHVGAFVTMAPICVYLYQVLVLWRGDFERVDIHPYIEICALGVFLWFRGRKAEASEPSAKDSAQ